MNCTVNTGVGSGRLLSRQETANRHERCCHRWVEWRDRFCYYRGVNLVVASSAVIKPAGASKQLLAQNWFIMTAVSEIRVKEVLAEITGGRCDADTVDYMSGMLNEELTSSLTAEVIAGLIGPFLSDSGVCASESDVLSTCAVIAERLVPVAQNSGSLAATKAEGDSVEDARFKEEPSRQCLINGNKPFCVEEFFNISAGGGGFYDPYLGLRKTDVNFNTSVPLSESLKIEAAAQKEREKQLRLMREWEKAKAPLPPPIKRQAGDQLQKVTDVIVNSFSVSVGGRELLKDATLKIVIGRKYGLVGRNGIGKSTFISALVRHELPGVQADLNIGCVEQEISQADLERTVLDAVLAVHMERTDLLQREKALLAKPQTEETGKLLAAVYQRLEDIGASSAEAEAASILSGLGFSLEMQQQRIQELSGGWRMRVALARALYATPDILCLDEPTNHLDLHAVAWLTEHLINSPGTYIIVSHSRAFLNDVCTDVIEFKDYTLKYYKGDYDTFERVKTDTERLQQRQYEAQQMKREHVQKFIDRFRYKAARAALVQSRIKALEKLPMLEAVTNDPALNFTFGEPEDVPAPVLQLSGAWFTYKASRNDTVLPPRDSDDWILKDVDLSVGLQSRIAICGVNGCGKSTLLRLLAGTSEPTKGFCRRANKLRIGFFSQHHVEQLDLTLNAVQQLQSRFPEDNLKDEDARSYLGRFGISGLLALEPLYILSGGQKSRVAIALMAYKNPHIMILDEPTNHLDLDAVQALIGALNTFEGGVIVVSHDMHLLSCVVDEVYHVNGISHQLEVYRGDIESYRKDLLKKRI